MIIRKQRLITGGMLLCAMCAFCLSGCALHKKEQSQERELLNAVEKVEDVQKLLRESGFDAGPIDGKMGWQTRAAVREYQRAQKLKVTGYIDDATYTQLYSGSFADSLFAFDSYMDKEIIEPRVEEVPVEPQQQQAPTSAVVAYESVKGELGTVAMVKRIQQALKDAGFDPGTVDGKIGSKTKKAIKDFQESEGLTADGVIGPKTWDRLCKYLPSE